MHAEMVMIFFGMLALMQVVLLIWRRMHARSFNTATLLGMWLFPAAISVYQAFWRFLAVWTLFTLANAYIIYGASRQPVQVGTPRCGATRPGTLRTGPVADAASLAVDGVPPPRRVYKWFYLAYYACSSLGYLGYVVMLLEIVGITRLFHDGADVFQAGMLLAFYGLYFGVLSRDIADLCSDTIAQNLGVGARVHAGQPGSGAGAR